MLVRGYGDDVVPVDDGVDDEAELRRRELEDALLYDVVAVEVVDEHDDLVDGRVGRGEPLHDACDLVVVVDGVDDLLEGARAVLVDGDLEDVRVYGVDELSLLVGGEVLAELLDEVVAEWVEDQVDEVRFDLGEHEVAHETGLAGRGLQLLLQEAAAELVRRELDVVELLQRRRADLRVARAGGSRTNQHSLCTTIS